jgi:molybdopterin converting factor small subunit
MQTMSSVTINVRLSGPLAQSLGARRAFGMQAGATVEDLLETIAVEAGIAREQAGSLAAVAGGSFLGRSQALADGDEVDVLVPVAGG